MRRRGADGRTALAILAVNGLAAACSSTPDADPRYRPAEGILEIVAVLRRHVPDDTYRFEPARDFTGRNVYRSTLVRLENLEALEEEALRAGHMDDVIAFAKGRSLERLRAFDLAAENYRKAAESDGPLLQEALRSASLCERLDESTALDARRAAEQSEGPLLAETVERLHADRVSRLSALLEEARGSHYEAVIREEIESADMARANYFVDARRLRSDGDVLAVAALQRIAMEHRDSKNVNRHLLALADLYADIANDYVEANPPESLHFDPPVFEEYVDSATRLYQTVANQDGATERLEAGRRLEAFVAFTLRVDSDRFSQ